MAIPDSDALRMRRMRRHKAGDHSLCKRCAAIRAAPGAEGVADPLSELRLLAARMVAAHTADPGNAMLARELRITLLAIAPHPAPDQSPPAAGAGGDGDDPDDELRELFAELGAS